MATYTERINTGRHMTQFKTTWTSGGLERVHTSYRQVGESVDAFTARAKTELAALQEAFPPDA